MARGALVTRAALAAAVVMALAGCVPDAVPQPGVTITQTPAANRADVPTPGPDPRPAVVWPLTGLDATGATPEERDRPALSIKIENSSSARPQTNLDRADVVYETMIDYGISRLIAVYQSDYPEAVGPIRSMRPHDENIVGPLDGPLIFSGAQKRFITEAAGHKMDLIAQDLGDNGFFRVSTAYPPHNLHGRPADFFRAAKKKHAPEAQWQIAYPAELSTAAVLGKPTKKIELALSPYAKPSWTWSKKRGRWLRYEFDDKHVTFAGKQIAADNIVILKVEVKFTTRVRNGIAVPETLVNKRSGSGWVATDGEYTAIKWKKGSQYAPFVLTTPDGSPVVLKPGQTWFELVPFKGYGNSQYVNFR